jgi:ribosomal protein S18 acetylase RimI-like enzyme
VHDRLEMRPATPGDAAFLAWGLDEAAGGMFRMLFGRRSGAILARVMAQPGHQLSYEHSTLAQLDGRSCGFCQGWPEPTPPADEALVRAAGWRSIRAAGISLLARPVVRALGRHAPGEWYLQALAVAPSARGAGVGRWLFADARRRAAAAGSEILTLDVDTANTPALALYERLGMHVVSTTSAPLLGGLRVQRMVQAVSSAAPAE